MTYRVLRWSRCLCIILWQIGGGLGEPYGKMVQIYCHLSQVSANCFWFSFLMSIEMNTLKKSIATTNQRLSSSALAKIRSSAQHLWLGLPFSKFTAVYHHLPCPSGFLQSHTSELNRDMLGTIIPYPLNLQFSEVSAGLWYHLQFNILARGVQFRLFQFCLFYYKGSYSTGWKMKSFVRC